MCLHIDPTKLHLFTCFEIRIAMKEEVHKYHLQFILHLHHEMICANLSQTAYEIIGYSINYEQSKHGLKLTSI